MNRPLPDEAATLGLGGALFRALKPGDVVFLCGNLGAGKTTLVRGYLRAAGYRGPVKSPTFTLVEEYRLGPVQVYHFDLYRLETPEDLASLGFRDYLGEGAICFIEWPERGASELPAADLTITLSVEGSGRRAEIVAHTASGHCTLAQLGGAESSA